MYSATLARSGEKEDSAVKNKNQEMSQPVSFPFFL
jgi:hypothetical protein